MGLVDELQGVRVCMDTAPIIYFIEKNPKYIGVLKPVFLEIDTGRIEAITSTITLLEVLVHPFRTKNDTLAEKYRDILLYSEGLTAFEAQLQSEPNLETRNRKSLKRPAELEADWEIRFGPDNRFRVFYSVEQENQQVLILAIGIKRGNRLIIGREEVNL